MGAPVGSRRVLKRIYPARHALLTAGRVLVSFPMLILLPLHLSLFGGVACLSAVIATCCILTALGAGAALLLRDASNLRALSGLLRGKSFGVYRPEQYVGSLPAKMIKYGRELTPHYRVLHIADGGYTAFQFAPLRSIIALPFAPDEINALKLFYVYHELGHIGWRNYLVATSGRPLLYRPHPDLQLDPNKLNGDELIQLAALVESESRREARAFWRPGNIWTIATHYPALWQGLVAVAPVFIFVEVSDYVSWCVLYIVGVAAAGALNNGSLRVEAEIEADWTALCQMAFFQHNVAASPLLKQKKLNPLTSNIVPMRDSNLTLADQRYREQVFNQVRPFFAGSVTNWHGWSFVELEDMMWQATHRYEAVRLVISLVIIVATGFIVEFHRLATSTSRIPLAFNLILVLGGFTVCVFARAHYRAQVERVIAANGVDMQSERWASL